MLIKMSQTKEFGPDRCWLRWWGRECSSKLENSNHIPILFQLFSWICCSSAYSHKSYWIVEGTCVVLIVATKSAFVLSTMQKEIDRAKLWRQATVFSICPLHLHLFFYIHAMKSTYIHFVKHNCHIYHSVDIKLLTVASCYAQFVSIHLSSPSMHKRPPQEHRKSFSAQQLADLFH